MTVASEAMAKGNTFHRSTHSHGIFGLCLLLLLLALPVSTQTQITVCTNKTVSGGNGSDGETWQIVVTLVMLVVTLVAMAKEVGPADMLMMLMLIGVLACGIVDVKEAVQGLFLPPTNTKFAHLQLRSAHQHIYPALFAWTYRGKHVVRLARTKHGGL